MAWRRVDPERLARVQEMPRSVSQVKEYLPELGGCPHRYYLGRVVRAWERPAAWGPQGTGVHAAAEAWERSKRTLPDPEVYDVFSSVYEEEINKLAEDTPNWRLWFDSFQGSGDRDVERRYEMGLQQVDAYLAYYEDVPDEVIWVTPDGEPAIELGFDVDLDGVRIKGFIDQVVQVRPPRPRTPSGALSKDKKALAAWEEAPPRLRPRDIKTGRKPGDPFQTGTYGVVLEQRFPGIEFPDGDFLMARTGRTTKPVARMPRERVVELVHRMDRGVKAGEFPPNPGDHCEMCPFRTACEYAE